MADARDFSVLGHGNSLGSPHKMSPFRSPQRHALQVTPGSSRKGKRRTLVDDEEAEEAEKTEDESDGMDMDDDNDTITGQIQQPVFSSGGSGRVCRALPNRGGAGNNAGKAGNAGLGRTVSLPADVFSAVHGF